MNAERLVKSQGTIYLLEDDLQVVRKEDGVISLIKAGGIFYNKGKEEDAFSVLKPG